MVYNFQKTTQLVHRMIARTFLGPSPVDAKGHKHDVDHINGKKQDNRLCNLQYVSRLEHARKTRATTTFHDNRHTRPVSRISPDRCTVVTFASVDEAAKSVGSRTSGEFPMLALGRRSSVNGTCNTKTRLGRSCPNSEDFTREDFRLVGQSLPLTAARKSLAHTKMHRSAPLHLDTVKDMCHLHAHEATFPRILLALRRRGSCACGRTLSALNVASGTGIIAWEDQDEARVHRRTRHHVGRLALQKVRRLLRAHPGGRCVSRASSAGLGRSSVRRRSHRWRPSEQLLVELAVFVEGGAQQ